MKRAEQRRRRVESAVPELRTNPFLWTRKKANRLTLIRSSDISDRVEEVLFATAEMLERFLVGQRLEVAQSEFEAAKNFRERRGKNWRQPR
jgi:hypothetical protein